MLYAVVHESDEQECLSDFFLPHKLKLRIIRYS